MASGAANYAELEKVTSRVNEYVRTVLTDVQGASGILHAPQLMPEAPSYTSAITELVMRMRSWPMVTAQLPRFLDMVLYEFGHWHEPANIEFIEEFGFSDRSMLVKQAMNVARFMQRHLGVTSAHFGSIIPPGSMDLIAGRAKRETGVDSTKSDVASAADPKALSLPLEANQMDLDEIPDPFRDEAAPTGPDGEHS